MDRSDPGAFAGQTREKLIVNLKTKELIDVSCDEEKKFDKDLAEALIREDKLSPKQIAAATGYSPHTISTMKTQINNNRNKKLAKKLIIENKLTDREIAKQSGFKRSSISNIRTQQMGMSKKESRKFVDEKTGKKYATEKLMKKGAELYDRPAKMMSVCVICEELFEQQICPHCESS